jgi:hypothetical protein
MDFYVKFKLIYILFLSYFPMNTYACSCIILPPGKTEAIKYKLEKSQAIFVGTVTNVSKKDEYTEIATFKVLNPIKGISQSEINLENSGCFSPSIKLGRTLLIYTDFKNPELLRTPPTCFEVESKSTRYESELKTVTELLKAKT